MLFQRIRIESLAAFVARLFGSFFFLSDASMYVAHMRVQTSAAQLDTTKGASDAQLIVNIQSMIAKTFGISVGLVANIASCRLIAF